MRLKATIAGLILLTSSEAVQAQHKLAYMANIDGTCSSLVVADVDQSPKCPTWLHNTAYEDNYSSFRLITDDGLVISFFGYDNEAKGDVAHLSVERVLITSAPKAESGQSDADLFSQAKSNTLDLKAEGDCEYTNPSLPDSHVNCEAKVDGKIYSFKFHVTGFKVLR